MASYHIKERNMNMIYMELRLLMEVECDLKSTKLMQILSFLSNRGFIACLTIFDTTGTQSENLLEQKDIMSLTIDMRQDKMRFKFWDGVSVMWLFHTQDLFDALDAGKQSFSVLYDKYDPLTEEILNLKKIFSLSIEDVSYKYYPNSDTEVVYEIVLNSDYNQSNYLEKISNKIDSAVVGLNDDTQQDLKFDIVYSYKQIGCTPCEKARMERDKNENK